MSDYFRLFNFLLRTNKIYSFITYILKSQYIGNILLTLLPCHFTIFTFSEYSQQVFLSFHLRLLISSSWTETIDDLNRSTNDLLDKQV